MIAVAETALERFEAFLEPAPGAAHRLRAMGLGAAEFLRAVRGKAASLWALLTRFPTELVNPEYWETEDPPSEADDLLRREHQGVRQIWRADRVPRSRALRPGLNLEPEILGGRYLLFREPDLEKIAGELTHDTEFSLLKGSTPSVDVAQQAAEDASRLDRSLVEEEFLARFETGREAHLLLPSRDTALAVLAEMIRARTMERFHFSTSPIPTSVLEPLFPLALGTGFACHGGPDWIDKRRTVEIRLHFGESQWSPLGTGREETALLYYDRTSGIWAFLR